MYAESSLIGGKDEMVFGGGIGGECVCLGGWVGEWWGRGGVCVCGRYRRGKGAVVSS